MGGYKKFADVLYGLHRLDQSLVNFGRAMIGDDPHGPFLSTYGGYERDPILMADYFANHFLRDVQYYGKRRNVRPLVKDIHFIVTQLSDIASSIGEFTDALLEGKEDRTRRWTNDQFERDEGPILFWYATRLEDIRRRLNRLINQLVPIAHYFPNYELDMWRSSATDRAGESGNLLSVAVYLSVNDPETYARVFLAIDHLVDAIGGEPIGPADIEYSSVFKRWWIRVKWGLNSDEMQQRMAKIEAYAESYLNERISDNNLKEAQAVTEVIGALADIPHACIRVGSFLVLKCTRPEGPIILTRPLSALEIRVLEKFPEIQKDPQTFLDLLGNAIAMKEDD